jgi:hypothetical protein
VPPNKSPIVVFEWILVEKMIRNKLCSKTHFIF